MSTDLWISLISAIDPTPDTNTMPAVLQSTIHLLESELVKARAALDQIQIQPRTSSLFPLSLGDELAVGAMEAYRQNLIGRAPDFYGTRRLTPKELGFEPMIRELTPYEIVPTPIAQPKPAPPRRAPLEEMLTNSLVLDHMAPYLSVPSMMALASSSRLLHNMITHTPYLFRHLDLTRCKGARLEDATMTLSHDENRDENDTQTEDEYYSLPLRRIFTSLERRSILQDVRTLVLDGLPVPADLLAEIILTDRFNVNILSIRECQHLNECKLMQAIQYAVRPTRPEGTPRVKGIYHFSPMHSAPRPVVRRKRYRDWWGDRLGNSPSPSVSSSNNSSDNEDEESTTNTSTINTTTTTTTLFPKHQQNEWYSPTGKLFKHSIEEGWAQTIQKCDGIIAFDATLCRGPRHDANNYIEDEENSNPNTNANTNTNPEASMLGPALATVALGPRGCDGCHSSPEGPAIWGQSADVQFPLLGPVPIHQSSIGVAKRPELIPGKHPVLIARCTDCLTDRWCHRCNKWFCENCLENPQHVRANLSPHQTAVRQQGSLHVRLQRGVSKDCWECGPTCASCKRDCQHTCSSCQGDYCIEHNEGCSATMCDWCNTSARHRMRSFH